MILHHWVAVVFDEDARNFLTSLAQRCHVWLVASDKNTDSARLYWDRAAPVEDALASGVTVFERKEGQPAAALATVLELIEDHHGEFAHDPPLNEVLIVGLEPRDAVLAVLCEWGYVDITAVPLGILATRRGPD